MILLSENINNETYIPILTAMDKRNVFGRVLTFTIDDLSDMVDGFNKNTYGLINDESKPNLSVNFEHNTGSKAAGWINEVKLSDDKQQILAKIEWTKLGIEAIEDKLYKYVSPEIKTLENKKKILTGLGLVNNPFIKDFTPITMEEDMPEENLNMLLEKATSLASEIKTYIEQYPADMDKFVSIFSFLMPAVENNKDEEMKTLLSETESNYSDRLAKLEATIATKDKELSFTTLLHEGKVSENQRKAYISGDMNEFVKLIENRPSVDLSEIGTSVDVAGNKDDDTVMSYEDACNEVIKLSDAKQKEGMDVSSSVSQVLNENPNLKAIYEKGE